MKRWCSSREQRLFPAKLWLALGGLLAAALTPASLFGQQFFPTPAFRTPANTPSSGSYSQQAELLRERMMRTGTTNNPPPAATPNLSLPPSVTPPAPRRDVTPARPVTTRQPSPEEIPPPPNRSILNPPQFAPPIPQRPIPPAVQPQWPTFPAVQPQRPNFPAFNPPPVANRELPPASDYKFPKLEESVEFRPHPPAAPTGPLQPAPYVEQDFAPTQYHPDKPYDPQAERDTFGTKKIPRTQRPWVELFRPQYDTGPIPRYPEIFGPTNVFTPQFMVYGDYRMGGSYIDPGNGNDVEKIANRLNLELDLKLTATERIHAFVDPFTNGNTFSSVVFGDGEPQFVNGLNGNFQTLFFEGDLGAMVGGAMGIDAPFDLPFTFGRIPLIFQNGIWMEDNFLGAAVCMPAKNSPLLDWSNYDVTYFVAIDEITSAAFGPDDSVANVYGSHWFIEAYKGYLEFGWAYLDDHTGQGLGYHNIGVSFQRRYFNAVSNALRCIVNVGQDPVSGVKTADGAVLLMENVFITDSPYFKLPYLNLFAGFGHPQSVARNAGAQGVLRNTGINFESDNLTNFPTIDNTANDTWGAAFGLDLLASDLSQQLIVEVAAVQVMGNDPTRLAKGNQYATGLRYQRPLNNSWIFRADAMHGWRDNDTDITGARIELRHKF